MKQAELLAEQLDGTREWTLKLIDDLHGDDWGFQPDAGMGHALWLCGHLAVAQDLLVHIRCLQCEPFLDESFLKHFAIGGPVSSVVDHAYPSVKTILSTMKGVHAKTCAAIREMSDDFLDEPAYGGDGKTPHPHYRDKRGALAHCSRHEAFHAGQIATIRRLLGKPFLR